MNTEDDGPRGGEPAGGGSGGGFDASNVPNSVWISLGGAVVLLISVFLNWYSVSADLGGAAEALGVGSFSQDVSGTDATDLAWLVFLLAAVVIAAWCIELFADTITLPFPAFMIAGAAGALSALVILFRIFDKPGPDIPEGVGIDIGTSYGIWLALIASIVVMVGAYLRMQETQ
jgi:hypothetical protein